MSLSRKSAAKALRQAAVATVTVASMVGLAACSSGGEAGPETEGPTSTYPDRQITYIIPYDPGGATDTAGREFASQLGAELGGTVVPMNQAGGSGLVGVTAAVTAEPDGYTLGFGAPGAILIQPLVDDSIATASTDNYTPIALTGTGPFALLVGGDSEWNSLGDLVDYAKDHPGEVQIATTGGLAINTFVIHAFAAEAGIDVTPIPFDGSTEGQRALLGGQVQALVASASGVVGQVESGEMKALAVSGSEDFHDLPDTPTFDSDGYYVPFEGAYMTVAPKGLPDDVLQRILDATAVVLDNDAWKEWCAENGTTPKNLTGDALTNWIHEQQDALMPYLELVQGS
ncbi:tripartite tricarboxylate transporter substrate binding protein [Microbacterium pseudoresistens]|uniref:Putative tricarboxylic transport membrane protein n=2 Tax=Microbacterium pseudoresistens TaxID=640634 RepID=A0A7Y9EUC4_9MICO|nr:putative tricarboxylic transport membrane protein [Microbacterium pseudoresistens]